MGNVDFAQNAMSIIGQNNGTHGIEQHFQHAAGTQRGTDNVGHGAGGLNVGQLGLSACLALCLGVCCLMIVYVLLL